MPVYAPARASQVVARGGPALPEDGTGAQRGTGGPRLYHEVHDGDGPYLLLVHGMLSSRAQWMPNLAALSAFSRPVVVELWGHGRSPTPDDPRHFSPDGYVDQFELLREELGVERWLLCGQSLGASFTLLYALEHPERVTAHAFTNTNSALAQPRSPDRMDYVRQQIERLRTRGRAAIDEHPMSPLLNRKLSPELRDALAADIARITVDGYAAMMEHTQPASPLGHRLGENVVPTLLVVGEREERFAVLREHAERSMPRLEVVGLDANHAVNINQAEGFNRALRDFFLRELARSAAAEGSAEGPAEGPSDVRAQP